jgi:hypothetical protein
MAYKFVVLVQLKIQKFGLLESKHNSKNNIMYQKSHKLIQDFVLLNKIDNIPENVLDLNCYKLYLDQYNKYIQPHLQLLFSRYVAKNDSENKSGQNNLNAH